MFLTARRRAAPPSASAARMMIAGACGCPPMRAPLAPIRNRLNTDSVRWRFMMDDLVRGGWSVAAAAQVFRLGSRSRRWLRTAGIRPTRKKFFAFLVLDLQDEH